ncbi:MAG: class I SAM-dependent methyltransferase [Propionibacteriaceae bacterium]|nr:class I SAM-dependent methyltransferase [Propionibacteriaceae bacterium]
MTTATEVYGLGLLGDRVWLEGSGISELRVRDWSSDQLPGDRGLLDRCLGRTLDLGCGPGRLTAALLAGHVLALGVDVSKEAVALARARGAAALQRDVFGPLPREGCWQHILLADGNIGIGGDPIRLLARCRELLDQTGTVLVDLQGTGAHLRTDRLRLRVGELASDWFHWSSLPTGALRAVAAAAGFSVVEVWRSAGRWQAELRVCDQWDRDQ